jgi:hypothetical protein
VGSIAFNRLEESTCHTLPRAVWICLIEPGHSLSRMPRISFISIRYCIGLVSRSHMRILLGGYTTRRQPPCSSQVGYALPLSSDAFTFMVLSIAHRDSHSCQTVAFNMGAQSDVSPTSIYHRSVLCFIPRASRLCIRVLRGQN